MLKMCSWGQDLCTSQGPGTGAYRFKGMTSSFFVRTFAKHVSVLILERNVKTIFLGVRRVCPSGLKSNTN